MYLFKRDATVLTKPNFQSSDDVANSASRWRAILSALTGEEPPRCMLGQLALLALLLHLWALTRLLMPEEPLIKAQPLTMQVAMVSMPGQKPALAPPAPPPKPQPRKKPVAPKQPPLVHKPEPRPEETPAIPEPATPAVAQPVQQPRASAEVADSPPVAEVPFIEADFQANYGSNPKPEYPRLARNRGWQGKVLLKVEVSAAGDSEQVSVHHSSGHDLLDESAIEAVEKWKFIPARRGDAAVASAVIVPIIFTLND